MVARLGERGVAQRLHAVRARLAGVAPQARAAALGVVGAARRSRGRTGRLAAGAALPGGKRGAAFLLLANGEAADRRFTPPAARGKRWRRLVDTAAAPPADLVALAEAPVVEGALEVRARSVVLLAAR